MEQTEKRKKIVRVILFLLIGILLFHIISTILLPEWVTAGDVTLSLRGFYQEKRNSIDVLFIGDSNVYRGVSPLAIWKEQGITSYDYSSPKQNLLLSYYSIKECLKTQKPKVIMLEVNQAFYEENPDEQSVRKVIDNMKLGTNKWQAINEPEFSHTNLEKLSYIFPIIRYHSRWDKLTDKDFARIKLSYHSTFKGYLPTKQIRPYQKKLDYMKKGESQEQIGQKAKIYLDKIDSLCKQNNIKLVLMRIPEIESWSWEKNQDMTKYAKEKQLDFLDMNIEEGIHINWETDSEDAGAHLNITGAEKVSAFLGKYLKEVHHLEDHREDNKYETWKQALEEYEKMKQNKGSV